MKEDPQVLIVDHQLENCLILEDILSSLDIRSACATSLKATDELLSEIKPAVVLIDQHLPDGHGFCYIPKIKEQFPEARVIAMATDEASQTKAAAINAGASEFLEKPFSVKQVCSAIFGAG